MNIQNQIKSVISNMVTQHGDQENGISEMEIMESLKQKGVMDEVMRHIQVDRAQNGKMASHFRDTDKLNGTLAQKGRLTMRTKLLIIICPSNIQRPSP